MSHHSVLNGVITDDETYCISASVCINVLQKLRRRHSGEAMPEMNLTRRATEGRLPTHRPSWTFMYACECV